MAAPAVGIILTEDVIEAMMVRTATADRAEEVEEGDGERLKTGIGFTEGGHLLLSVAAEGTGHAPDLHPTRLVPVKP